mmetsp:Transcript_71495/g.209992  ORF Transcript_71495/g.209992 Transcript_71495/m.209992 type:complete len:241 (-) Transcript_71495:177-899(-)
MVPLSPARSATTDANCSSPMEELSPRLPDSSSMQLETAWSSSSRLSSASSEAGRMRSNRPHRSSLSIFPSPSASQRRKSSFTLSSAGVRSQKVERDVTSCMKLIGLSSGILRTLGIRDSTGPARNGSSAISLFGSTKSRPLPARTKPWWSRSTSSAVKPLRAQRASSCSSLMRFLLCLSFRGTGSPLLSSSGSSSSTSTSLPQPACDSSSSSQSSSSPSGVTLTDMEPPRLKTLSFRRSG